MKKVIRLTESDLVRIVKRVIREEEKQNLFPDAPVSSSNDSTFTFKGLQDGYYQVYPTNTLPHEVYKYLSNFNSDDREDIWEHIYKRTFIEASGEFNRIHFREGIHPFLQGLGMGYIIYEDFIKFLGYASSTDSATEDSKRVWKKLIKDPDFYGVYCNNGDVLAVYKNWGGDIPSLIKSFIRGRNDVSFISDKLLSDYPDLNDVMKLSESDLKRIVKRVITEQGLVDPIFDLSKPGFEGIKGVRTPSGRTPKVEDGVDPDLDCKYLPFEKVKHFFDEAKTWNYSVDEVFMKKIIDGLKKHLDDYWGGSSGDVEIERLLSQVKTKPGMGYLVRNFKLNNKNLYDSLDSYYRPTWNRIVSILEKNFDLPYGPSGCGGQL